MQQGTKLELSGGLRPVPMQQQGAGMSLCITQRHDGA